MTFLSLSIKSQLQSVNEPISVYKEKDPVFTLGLSTYSSLLGKIKPLIGGIKLMNHFTNSSTKLATIINTTAVYITAHFTSKKGYFPMK